MSARREPGLGFYGWVYALGCLAVVSLSAAGIAYAIRTGMWPVAVVCGAWATWWAYAVKRRFDEFRAHAHLPGPRPSFFLGNLPALMACGHGGRDRALEALHREFGPVVRIHLAWGSAPYVSLSYSSANLHKKHLDSQRRADRTVLPRSLMGIEMGEVHKAHRQAMMPFLSSRSVKDRSHVLQERAVDYVARWRGRGGVELSELLDDIHGWSAHCLGAFLFGDAWDTDEDLHAYFGALSAIEEEVSFRAFHPFFVRWIFPRRLSRVRAAYRYLFSFFEEVKLRKEHAAATCRHGTAPSDLLHGLVGLESARAAGPWTHHDCIEEMMSLVLGGTDAMSYTLCQALFLLSRNPAVQAAARRSLEPAGADPDPGAAALDTSFVKNVVYETLRLYPPVPFSAKVSREDVVEMNMPIPAGTTLMWAKNVVGKNATIFADPDAFRPDRFSREDDSISTFLPFGAGPRHCIGNRLAEEQCTTLLCAVLQHFQIEPIEDIDVTFHATVSIAPSSVPVRLWPLGRSTS